MTAIKLRDLGSRNLDLLLIAERKGKECHESADQAQTDHPPDVPDQGEASDDRKERVDESDRAVLRGFD